jgi:hypothetical protein
MTTKPPSPKGEFNLVKFVAIGLGGLVGVAHIGILGHLIHDPKVSQPPVFNIPNGPYSSYRIKAGKDGYEIEYRANDPKVLESERSLNVDQNKRGLFGGGSEKRNEYRRDQYTQEGHRNLQGGELTEGKNGAKSEECIRADAGSRSQGALAGTSIAAGALVPAVINIPYVGWLAAGWMTLLGQRVGSDIGSQVGKVFNDC